MTILAGYFQTDIDCHMRGGCLLLMWCFDSGLVWLDTRSA